MSRAIPALDLAFYAAETAATPMHVGMLLRFERPPRGSGAMVAAEVFAAYRRARPVAPFDRVPRLSRLGRPQWADASEIDMAYHVQHATLEPPGDDVQLVSLIEKLHVPLLPRDRPGFRAYVIDGLADGGFAIYCKMHHALVDGISAVQRGVASLERSPSSKRARPLFAVDLPTAGTSVPPGLARAIGTLAADAWRQASAVTDLSASLVKSEAAKRFVGAAAGNAPFSAPRTPLNVALSPERAFATLSLPLDAMKAAGAPFGATLNDVAATIVDAALHRYLAARSAALDRPLVAGCAMSLREPNDTEAATKATTMFVPLGAPDASLAERIAQIVAANAAAKAELKAMSKDAARAYGLLAFGIAKSLDVLHMSGVAHPMANFVLSNVPGPREPLYLRGARLTAMAPISALAPGLALNVTLVSYANTVCFGLLADRDALPDVADLAGGIRDAFDALRREAARARDGATSRIGRTRSRRGSGRI